MWYVLIYLHNENETILQYFPWESEKVQTLLLPHLRDK